MIISVENDGNWCTVPQGYFLDTKSGKLIHGMSLFDWNEMG